MIDRSPAQVINLFTRAGVRIPAAGQFLANGPNASKRWTIGLELVSLSSLFLVLEGFNIYWYSYWYSSFLRSYNLHRGIAFVGFLVPQGLRSVAQEGFKRTRRA